MIRNRQRPPATSVVRSRAGFTVVALVLGLGVALPDGALSTAAEPQPRFSRLLSNDEFVPAERGTPTAVGVPQPEDTPEPSDPAPATTTADDVHAAMASDVIALTNVERVDAGLPPLTWNPSLDTAAMTHANDQRNVPCEHGFLTHTGSDGSNGGERILRTGLDIRRWGENIGCAHKSAASIVRGWMRSPGHRANILNGDFTQIGVAVAASDSGELYWVQMFATMR